MDVSFFTLIKKYKGKLINYIFSLWRNKPQKAGAFVLYAISTDHNVSGRVWHALTENCGEVLH